MRQKLGFLGIQISSDAYGSPDELLDDLEFLDSLFSKAAEIGGLHVIRDKIVRHRFSPHGVTLSYPIEESHMNIHTWPEYGYALIDILSCGESSKPHTAMRHILTNLYPTDGLVTIRYRGVLDAEKVNSSIYLPPQKYPETLAFSLQAYLDFVAKESLV